MVEKEVLIFGSNGLVGSSCVRILTKISKINSVIASNRNDTNLFSFDETKRKNEELQTRCCY